MSADPQPARRVLILGGGGMVGIQVAREIAKKLRPESIVISALTQEEVDAAVEALKAEATRDRWGVEISGVSGDIFLPMDLQGHRRSEIVRDQKLFDILFDDVYSSDPDAWTRSEMVRLIRELEPDVIVDCINTATAISYQDVYTTSKRVKVLLERLESSKRIEESEVPEFIGAMREILVAQGVPQITRHILFLHRALTESAVRVYVKVGTTGTGGMGVNVPYTHSEEKPSPTLLSKSAIGFAHTGLLFLLARTPGTLNGDQETNGTMIKEVKPGAMIGFRRLGRTHVKINGPSGRREPGVLYESRTEVLGESLNPREDWGAYQRYGGADDPIEMVGADTGENGFFSIGEFEAITYPRQMEYVTPEEVARTVVLEILGSSTGRDVIAAIDGAITEPSYRAGLLRHHAVRELDRLEALVREAGQSALPSMPIGHLGPPQLTKLITEAFLIREGCQTDSITELAAIDSAEMRERVESWLESNPRVARLITTIGLPILRSSDDGLVIERGPRLNIPAPSPDDEPLSASDSEIESWAEKGWIDLRPGNFESWKIRLQRLIDARPSIDSDGSAAFDRPSYIQESFRPGEVVGWLLANEPDDSGMVGHRVL